MNTQTKINDDTAEGQRILSDFVGREVIHCVSGLISDLCKAGLYHESCSFGELHSEVLIRDDWETPASDHIRTMCSADTQAYVEKHGYSNYGHQAKQILQGLAARDYEEFCGDFGIEPHQVEALEHWIVSDWLADRLIARGEMVDKGVHGLIVWGRTCSGQAIHLDGVIADIYNELHGVTK